MPSKIEWTDETWNPVAGCTLVSEGCRNCYAMRQAHRMNPSVASSRKGRAKYNGTTMAGTKGPTWTGVVRTVESEMGKPMRWQKPRLVFVCSMADLFHPDVPFEFIDRMVWTMCTANQHTYQLLTKRPERALEYFSRPNAPELLGNVWLGTSVEDQTTADGRIPYLLRCPTAVRFISYEPALGPVNMDKWMPVWTCFTCGHAGDSSPEDHCPNCGAHSGDGFGLAENDPDFIGLDWVIAGGESGPNARPAHPDWFRSMRDQCQAAGVPFFFKQWGAWASADQRPDLVGDGEYAEVPPVGLLDPARRGRPDGCVGMVRAGKKAAGRVLDGRTWEEMPSTELVTDGKA